jgi:hypothetical protein
MRKHCREIKIGVGLQDFFPSQESGVAGLSCPWENRKAFGLLLYHPMGYSTCTCALSLSLSHTTAFHGTKILGALWEPLHTCPWWMILMSNNLGSRSEIRLLAFPWVCGTYSCIELPSCFFLLLCGGDDLMSCWVLKPNSRRCSHVPSLTTTAAASCEHALNSSAMFIGRSSGSNPCTVSGGTCAQPQLAPIHRWAPGYETTTRRTYVPVLANNDTCENHAKLFSSVTTRRLIFSDPY